MKKTTKKYIIQGLKVALIAVFGVLFIAILIKARLQAGESVCNEIQVNVKNADKFQFIAENEIIDFINNNGKDVVINQRLKDVSKSEIEARIEQSEYIEKADVFTNFEGKMRVDVTQKNPIYRVFNNNGVSYYVSNKGESIPISSKFTPRLIVATGNLSKQLTSKNLKIREDLLELVAFINESSFWEAMIGQIEVANNGDFLLYSKIDEHVVNIGNTDNLEDKFKYLQIFYKEAIKNVDWKQYEEINLKFKGQIICKKKIT
jgi:cell division protein FtsQ